MKNDPHNTNGGNGGYSLRKPVKDTPNRQTRHKGAYNYKGKDVSVKASPKTK